MQRYSLDIDFRWKVYVSIGAISVGASIVATTFLNSLDFHFIAPTAFSLFPLIYLIFDNYIWKMKWIKLLIKIPDLNGTWKGISKRRLPWDAAVENIPIEVKIHQTFSKIEIIMGSKTTKSKIRYSKISIENPTEKTLEYVYNVEYSHANVDNEKNFAYGLAKLVISKDEDAMNGFWFASYPSRGDIQLKVIK